MSAPRPHVLIVGGTGTFGSRLARLLARRKRYRITLGGRDGARSVALQAELRGIDPDGEFGFATLDRNQLNAERLKEIGVEIVVDCAGPFDAGVIAVVEASIAAGCTYIDLADQREFVARFGRFDLAARKAGVAVITGASSTPALTHAVLDSMTSGWLDIDSVDAAIVPGNRTPKGPSVIAAILSWVGQKIPVFAEGQQQDRRAWSGTEWVLVDGIGRRRAALADLPDLDLMQVRYRPRVRAGFKAGMELAIIHRLIGLAGLAVKLRVVRSARAFAGIGTWVARALDRFGTDSGGMVVEAAGRDPRGEPRLSRWSLAARSGDGPYVPAIPAAALIQKIVDGQGPPAGAHTAAGLLTLDEIRPWFDGLAIETKLSTFRNEKPLYRLVMGIDFDTMPAPTRRLHRGRPAVTAEGEAEVFGAANPIAGVAARLVGLPRGGGRVPLRVIIESREGREHWTRFFDGRPMRSVMRRAGEGLIEERFGLIAVRMRLVPRPDGLDMQRHSGRFAGIPLPSFLLPRIKAEERVDERGRHSFDVEIRMPLLGRLVAYRGYLRV